jgi:cysteinyl-tRNA synthetase
LASEASQTGDGDGEDETGALLDLLVDMRTDAKTNKDWGTADKIRDVLAAHGITIQDGKDGSSWSRG